MRNSATMPSHPPSLAKIAGFADDGRLRKSWQPQIVDGAPNRVILFDGACVLCSRRAPFVMARDIEGSEPSAPDGRDNGEAAALSS
jgi:hypothetical protein